MNNEPVAWMYQIHDITGWTWVIDQRLPDYEYRNEKPLYTHPADLTDEEIWEVINRTAWVGAEEEIRFKIAEAILRKAQEK